MRTLIWDNQTFELQMIDQRLLPGEFKFVRFRTHHEVADAIKTMVVRGAPAIGAAAAFGLALTACRSAAVNLAEKQDEVQKAADILRNSRPTAVNLFWAIDKMLIASESCEDAPDKFRTILIHEAQRIADEDVEINKQIARLGAELIDDGDTIIHHCNTGALATVDWGTALGVIRMAHEKGKNIHVLVDETRPRLQGARLTAWELNQYGISHEIISDNAAGFFLQTRQVQKVIFGADRVAANGDVANKIGTYMLALAAFDNQIPTFAAVPISTIDLKIKAGDQIPIEERDQDEVLGITFQGQPASPAGSKARNPAFDVTPNRLISAIITEKGLIYPPFTQNLSKMLSTQ